MRLLALGLTALSFLPVAVRAADDDDTARPDLERAEAFVATLSSLVDEAEGVGVEDLRSLFAEATLRALPAQAVSRVIGQMGSPGAVRARHLLSEPGPVAGGSVHLYELLQDEAAWIVRVSIDGSGRVVGWFNRPGAMPADRDELFARTASVSGAIGLCAVLRDADGTELDRVELSRGRRDFPLGSVFKLYVLAELCRRVTAGELSLEQTLPIRTEAKSLPSGTMHLLEAGTEVTLREMAEKMIAISDNTATDHLVDLLGREAIEAHLAEYACSVPEKNRPFLKTREMFQLKGSGRKRREAVFGTRKLGEAVDAWVAADREQRLAWIAALEADLGALSEEKLRGQLLGGYASAALSPVHQEIEWFARPADVVDLLAMAEDGRLVDGPTSELFLELYGSAVPAYPYPGVRAQGSKGGSETGVFVQSARVALEDGRSVLVCLARAGFSPLETQAPVTTQALFLSWIRSMAERR